MKKIITTSLIIFLSAATAFAQKNLVGVAWEINFPTNTDYVDKTSYAGGKIEYRHFFKQHVSGGIALNWCTYEQHLPRQTFQKPDGNGAVTTDFVAQIYQLPITATVHYYFKESKLLKPYAGIALGGQYLQQSLYYNVYVSDDDNWGFVARPELGTIIKPGEHVHNWGFLLAANFSYSTNKTDLIDNNSFKNFGVSIGVVFGE
jgi:hypothetical protein